MRPIKTAYVEGRPHSHPIHAAYAKAVDSTFHFVDFKLRYHDVPSASSIRRYVSWLVCALSFPKRNSYDVFLSEEAYFMLGFMKKLGLMNRRQKLFAIMASHTLYFLYTNQYSKSTKNAFIKLFNIYDVFICLGPIQYEILKTFVGSNVKIYKTFNGITKSRFWELIAIEPKLEKLNIVTIGAILNKNRLYYKGIDLMLEAFAKVKPHFPELTFTIVGDYDPLLISDTLIEKCPNFINDVILTGQTNDLKAHLSESCLYLHTARGEAWGISVTEAMTAGVVPIVSEWTGSKEAVEQVSENLIVALDASVIFEKILWYLNMPIDQKKILSTKCKEVASFYTEERAIENFKKIFDSACEETYDSK